MNDLSSHEWFKARGICVRCRKEKAARGRTMCLNCLDEIKLRRAEYWAVQSPSERAETLKKMSRYRKTLYADRKAAGLCVTCGKPAWNGHVRCWECSVRNANSQRRRQQKKRQRKPAGACRFCDSPALDGYKVCQTHYDHMIKMNRSVKNRDVTRRQIDALWRLKLSKGGTA